MSYAPPQHAEAGGSNLSALHLTLRPLQPLLADQQVTEVCINRPQEAFIEVLKA